MVRRTGFTLIELLVVMSIVVIMAALITTGTMILRRRANDTVCMNNLHQIGLGLQLYEQDWGDVPAGTMNPLYPQYVSSLKVFICPNTGHDVQWSQDLLDLYKRRVSLGLGKHTAGIYTYWYYPFLTAEGARKRLPFILWPKIRDVRGDETPVVWCKDHTLLQDERKNVYKLMILRLNGQIQKRTVNTHGGFFWPDQY